MINKDFFLALDALEKEKGIKKQTFIDALEAALIIAYKKNNGEASNVLINLDEEKSSIRFYAIKEIVEEVEDAEKQISLEEAKMIKKTAKIGSTIQQEFIPKNFGRIAAQTAKQVIMQKLREAERDITYSEFSEKEDELITGTIRRIEDDTVFVDIGSETIEGVLLKADQVAGEKYILNESIKVYVKKVKNGTKGPQIFLSRTVPNFVKRLFESEIPEIRQGIVVIKSIAREAGQRTKIAIYSEDSNVDALGACVGPKGTRVNSIVSELGGEKIDIINWTDDIVQFVAQALSPAQVLMVKADQEEKIATVVVPDNKLSLAIGKDGQNARLAAKLTGWKIDVKPESAVNVGEIEGAEAVEETQEVTEEQIEE